MKTGTLTVNPKKGRHNTCGFLQNISLLVIGRATSNDLNFQPVQNNLLTLVVGYNLSEKRSFLDRLKNITSHLPDLETDIEGSNYIGNEVSVVFMRPRVWFSFFLTMNTFISLSRLCLFSFYDLFRDVPNSTVVTWCRYWKKQSILKISSSFWMAPMN